MCATPNTHLPPALQFLPFSFFFSTQPKNRPIQKKKEKQNPFPVLVFPSTLGPASFPLLAATLLSTLVSTPSPTSTYWLQSGFCPPPFLSGERERVKSLSRVWLFATPWTVAHQAPSIYGIIQARVLEWVAISFSFPTQGSNPGLPHCRQTLYRLSHQRPSLTASELDDFLWLPSAASHCCDALSTYSIRLGGSVGPSDLSLPCPQGASCLLYVWVWVGVGAWVQALNKWLRMGTEDISDDDDVERMDRVYCIRWEPAREAELTLNF